MYWLRHPTIRYTRSPPCGFSEVTVGPRFFFSAPAKAPRQVCACQPVAAMIWVMLAPSGRRSMSISSASVIVPLGILLALKLVPADLMAELRAEAERRLDKPPVSRVGAAVTVAIWLAAATAISWWLANLIRG